MARFEPFVGIRYDQQRSELSRVIAPPYDVIDEAQRAALAARDPHNAVLIDLPSEADGDRERAASEFGERMRESVRIHARSDVPVGTCLSGSQCILYAGNPADLAANG